MNRQQQGKAKKETSAPPKKRSPQAEWNRRHPEVIARSSAKSRAKAFIRDYATEEDLQFLEQLMVTRRQFLLEEQEKQA